MNRHWPLFIFLIALAASAQGQYVEGLELASGRRGLEDRGPTGPRVAFASFGGAAVYPEVHLGLPTQDCPALVDSAYRVTPRSWWRVGQPHPFLDSLFPGVRLALTFSGGAFSGAVGRLVIAADGRAYDRDQLTSFLSAQGFKFDSAETYTIAKVAVLFAYFGNLGQSASRNHVSRGMRPSDIFWDTTVLAFPEVAFETLEFIKDTVKAHTVCDFVRVAYSAGGEHHVAEVAFLRPPGPRVPLWIVGPSIGHSYTSLDGAPGEVDGEQGSVDSRGVVDFAGDVWIEYKDPYRTNAQHMVCLAKDGQATQDTVVFVLSGGIRGSWDTRGIPAIRCLAAKMF